MRDKDWMRAKGRVGEEKNEKSGKSEAYKKSERKLKGE